MSTDGSASDEIDGERDTREREVSYGGVVVRDGTQLLVITPRGGRRSLLGLPKGGRLDGESPEQTAAREVLEETGVRVDVGTDLGRIDYSYRRAGKRVFKSVHFFLCRHLEGEPRADGVEVSRALWIPFAGAPELLSYRGERAIVRRALSELNGER